MKTFLLTLTFCIASVALFAQYDDIYFKPEPIESEPLSEPYKLESSEIVWQRVFDNAQVDRVAELTGQLNNVSFADNVITGELTDISLDYKAQGLKRSRVPLFMCYPYTANVLIETKDNRYRVTVTNLRFEEFHSASSRFNGKTYNTVADVLLDKNSEYKPTPLAVKSLALIDTELTNRFTIDEQTSDW